MTTLSFRPVRHRLLLLTLLTSFGVACLSRWLLEPRLQGLTPFQHDLASTLLLAPVTTFWGLPAGLRRWVYAR